MRQRGRGEESAYRYKVWIGLVGEGRLHNAPHLACSVFFLVKDWAFRPILLLTFDPCEVEGFVALNKGSPQCSIVLVAGLQGRGRRSKKERSVISICTSSRQERNTKQQQVRTSACPCEFTDPMGLFIGRSLYISSVNRRMWRLIPSTTSRYMAEKVVL